MKTFLNALALPIILIVFHSIMATMYTPEVKKTTLIITLIVSIFAFSYNYINLKQ